MLDYGILQDRLCGDTLNLPFQWDDVKLTVNSPVISDTINYSIDALYQNWLYLLARSVIPTNDIPDESFMTHVIMDKGSNVIDFEPYEDDYRNGNSVLDDIKNIEKIQNLVDPNNFNVIATTTTNVILMSGTGTANIDIIVNPDGLGETIVSNSSITHPSNGILFENIVDFVVTQNNDLFVLDNNHNQIFKFDISGITTLDEAVLKNDTPGRLMTGIVGGHGPVTSKVNFKNAIAIATRDNLLYVLDHDPGTKHTVIKQFDSFLNWVESYDLGVISDQTAIDIEYNSMYNQFFILLHNNDTVKNVNSTPPQLISYTLNFDYIETRDLVNYKEHDLSIGTEVYKKIYMSNENKNIFYVVTNKSVFKKYISRPIDFIGEFKFDELSIGSGSTDRNITDLCVFPLVVTDTLGVDMLKDEIYLFEDNYNTIYRFVEDSAYENSFELNIEQKTLALKHLIIKPEENVDVIVYNKMLYKNIYNNLILLENTSRRFATVYDDNGISQYIGFKYLTNPELEEIVYNVSDDHYVSSNEIILTETVNRCLKKIYDLQIKILTNMQETSMNVYPDPSRVVILT
jgi:hypothetical protein